MPFWIIVNYQSEIKFEQNNLVHSPGLPFLSISSIEKIMRRWLRVIFHLWVTFMFKNQLFLDICFVRNLIKSKYCMNTNIKKTYIFKVTSIICVISFIFFFFYNESVCLYYNLDWCSCGQLFSLFSRLLIQLFKTKFWFKSLGFFPR